MSPVWTPIEKYKPGKFDASHVADPDPDLAVEAEWQPAERNLLELAADAFLPFTVRQPENPHDQSVSWGRVFANEKAEAGAVNGEYLPGAVFVREKLGSADAQGPETVTVMIKRQKGFSTRTKDWEFVVMRGSDLVVTSREKRGDCAKCHTAADKSDWVFGKYFGK